MTATLAIGTAVTRTAGDRNYIGLKGTVVEMSGDRARVLWAAHGSQKAKRTWVNVKTITVTPAESVAYTSSELATLGLL